MKVCGGCGSARYCGADCQRADWDSHNKACTQRATTRLIEAVAGGGGGEDVVETVKKLAKTKRVLNGRVNFTRSGTNFLGKRSALHECVFQNNPEMAGILIEAGANLEIKDADGEAPLFVACSSSTSSLEVALALIGAGANPDARARDGWSCLMMAARGGGYEVCRALLEAGADLYAGRDMYGLTALDLVEHFRTGQAMCMSKGETMEEALAKYERLHSLLSQYA